MRPIAAHAGEDQPQRIATVIDLVPFDERLPIYTLPPGGHGNATQLKAHEVAPIASDGLMEKANTTHGHKNPVRNLDPPSETNAR